MLQSIAISTKLFSRDIHEQKFDAELLSVHEAKSVGGKNFLQPYVLSVCVFDNTGKVWLYLKKDADGHCIMREEAKE